MLSPVMELQWFAMTVGATARAPDPATAEDGTTHMARQTINVVVSPSCSFLLPLVSAFLSKVIFLLLCSSVQGPLPLPAQNMVLHVHSALLLRCIKPFSFKEKTLPSI